jgi:hypothetical protein
LDELTKEEDQVHYILFSNRSTNHAAQQTYTQHQRHVEYDIRWLVANLRYTQHQQRIRSSVLPTGETTRIDKISKFVHQACCDKSNHLTLQPMERKRGTRQPIVRPPSLGPVQPLPSGTTRAASAQVEYDNVISYLNQKPPHTNDAVILEWMNSWAHQDQQDFYLYLTQRRQRWSTTDDSKGVNQAKKHEASRYHGITTDTKNRHNRKNKIKIKNSDNDNDTQAGLLWAQTMWLAERCIQY